MGNGDVALVNARREYMGNVTVLVNQTSLSRGCTVFKKTRGFFFRQSYRECFLLNRTCVKYINLADQLFLRGKRN